MNYNFLSPPVDDSLYLITVYVYDIIIIIDQDNY